MRTGVGESLRVLLVGTRILPFRHQGDKNYWLDVIRRLLGEGHELEVLSVTPDPGVGQDGLPLRYVRPIPVHFDDEGTRFNAEHAFLAGTGNYASKTVSLPRILGAIRARRRAFRPDVLHFADNYGPAMLTLPSASRGLPAAISAPTYHRNRALYDLFLRMSLRAFDTVVPFSEAFARRLAELGLPRDKVRTIRWGIDTEKFRPPSAEERAAAREALGVPGDVFLVLWTGFTQQSDRPELDFAWRAAVAAAEGPPPIRFAFCFKPEHYRAEYESLARPGITVHREPADFLAAMAGADLLLSPLLDARSTAAPPLVWAEALARGLPLLTNAIPGAEEAAVPGTSGILVRTVEDARDRMLELAADVARRGRLREGARRIALERFDVRGSVARHVDLWRHLAPAKPSSPPA
jgi:glycosyltransferase involved in cell wall biosynthesis